MMRLATLVAAVSICGSSATLLLAALDYSSIGSNYVQNFDSLAATGIGHSWTNDSTIPGWSLFRVTAGADSTPFPMSAYDATDGSAGAGRFYSFGATDDGDRSLGAIGGGNFGNTGDQATGVGLGAADGWIALSLMNSTGSVLNQVTVGYDGEQWRDAGDNEPPAAQTMTFEYGFGSTFASVTWTAPGGSFDFTSPVFTTTDGPVAGNTAGRVSDLGGTITDLDWQAGSVLWLRWVERNDPGLDHGMGIDNFSFAAGATAIPEPSAFLLHGAVGGMATIAVAVQRILRISRRGRN
ncbi:MAG TPA: hypothetical protein VGK58_20150 [Lacipirellulaceae bacterium]